MCIIQWRSDGVGGARGVGVVRGECVTFGGRGRWPVAHTDEWWVRCGWGVDGVAGAVVGCAGRTA